LFSALGLYVNAAACRGAGHRVSVVDALYLGPELPLRETGTGGLRRLGSSPEEWVERVVRSAPDVVMVYASLFSHPDRFGDTLLPETFAALRRALPGSRIGLCDCFIGGLSYYPYDAVAVLREHPEIDFALTHETEVTADRFLRRLRRGDADFGDIPGLAWPGSRAEPRYRFP